MADDYHIIISPRASTELQHIHDYIERDSSQNATSVLRRLVAAIDSLAFMPQRHAVYAGRRNLPTAVRRMPVSPYLIDYRVEEDRRAVHIIAIRDGRRRQPRRFE